MIKMFCRRCNRTRWHNFSMNCNLCGNKNNLDTYTTSGIYAEKEIVSTIKEGAKCTKQA